MRHYPGICALVGVAMLATACGGGMPEPATAASGDVTPINELRAKYEAAYGASDAAALGALYADDAISLPDHYPAVEGRTAIQQYWQGVFTQYRATITMTPGETEVFGDVAHEHGEYKISVTPIAGGNTIHDGGKYVFILKRGPDGVWKIHHDADNSNAMPPRS